jgi:hypothetical protein
VEAEGLRQLAVYTLTDKAEQDDHCANLYHKSLLYLVSRAFEDPPRAVRGTVRGEPLLGMERHLKEHERFMQMLTAGRAAWVQSPNDADEGPQAARCRSHGGFDDDAFTVRATLSRILGRTVTEEEAKLTFRSSASKQRDIRRSLDLAS